MSVILYTGSPGSGKSYHAAKEIIFQFQRGRSVITNFPIYLENYSKRLNRKCSPVYVPNEQLTVNFLVSYAHEHHKRKKEGQTLVVIDECSTLFNSRDFNAANRKEWLIFFAQHRKYFYNILLICQFDKQIDKQIRGCFEYEYYHMELKRFNSFSYFLSLLLGKVFIVRKYIYSPFGTVHTRSNRCGFSVMRLNKRKSSIYDTFKIFDKKIDNIVADDTVIDVENKAIKGAESLATVAQIEQQSCIEESSCYNLDTLNLL